MNFGKDLGRQVIWSTKKVMLSSRDVKNLDGSNKRGAGKKKIQQSAPGLLRPSGKLIERGSGKVFHYVLEKGAVKYRDVRKGVHMK